MRKNDDLIINITDDVKWIGILDYDIKTFDIVMTTEYGTTYNSYLINAEKKALIEVAKEKFSDTYFKKLRSVTDPRDISYIILDHTEPDHSGSLKLLLEIAPSATVVGSGNAIRYLEDITNVPFRSLVVKDGDTLDLGNKTLQFIAAPNLHWPDSIYTYLIEDRILFTCDSFGAHYCSYDMSDDLNKDYLEALKYYFDVILKPFSRFMIKAIDRIRPLEINCICPGHGPILRLNRNEIVNLTEKYAREYIDITTSGAKRHILIAYVSAYGFTKEAAEHIISGIRETSDFNIDIADIENIDLAELDAKIAANDAIIIGSPTINQNTLLPVYKMFALINPIRDKGKLAGAFGSYGWSGEASRIIIEVLKNLKLNVFDEGSSFKFRPSGSKEEALKEFGRKFALKFEEESAQKERG
ncbi:MAG: MBL fold metallo-hydrolase [Bacteroidetes bacterium RBG_19FT_COMBO_42_10]|nr:MAG: MBL fold metallo-hydrolase [Bacteroidetes bacterium RBG_19FT_COMBO_42_10]